ncbi:unnamed protein product [Paramecium primaurelia]|uniref:Uncharacterized protein n=1 Tax=Paramecium primaurelia TaxID=5886 RepID=A0A8S1LEE6_PARPR|nr:unnamed protein product [Paramecium primaurelia]
MKQSQVNKFLANMTNRQYLQSVASPTTTAPSKHKKNGSSTIITGNKYLVYAKHSSRLFKDSSSKLPLLTTVMKTESQDIPKTAIVRTRKTSANLGDFRITQLHHRNKTETILVQNNFNISKQEELKDNFEEIQKDVQPQIPQVQKQIEQIQQQPLTTSLISESIKFQPKVHLAEVLGEQYHFTQINYNSSKITKIDIKQQINEIESLNEKSCHLMRKLAQLLNTHREKQTLVDLEIKKKKEFLNLTDRVFTQTLSNMPDERTPKINESKFNQKLSTIAKKQSKINYNYSVQETESLTPLKTIVEALKDKKNDRKDNKDKSKIELQQITQQISNKKLKITVIYEENEQQIEFQLPSYINEIQPYQEQIEIKETKQSNIYSLVSKQMLQNKFALRLVKKFGDRVIQTQEDNDAIENFNSFKACQFTRYYLQNHVQKCLETKYETRVDNDNIQNNKNEIFDYPVCQDTYYEMLSKSTGQVGVDQYNIYINKSKTKKLYEIHNIFYQVSQRYFEIHQVDNSILSPSGSQLDLSDIEMQNYFKINYIYYALNLVSINDLKQAELRVIVNTIDDETKNKFLHEELMKFPEITNTIIQNQDNLDIQQLQLINQLEIQLASRDQTIIKNQFSNKFSFIQVGLFEDYFSHQINALEKIYIEYCKTMRDLDKFNTKDRIKTEQPSNLNIPSMSRSRLQSPTGSSESKTLQKELNPMITKGLFLKKHQRQKKLLTNQKFTTSTKLIQGSTSNLQTLLHANTNTNTIFNQQKTQKFQTIQKDTEPQVNNESQRQIQMKQHFNSQSSMDPSSLLFRNMLLQESSQNDKSNIERVFSLIEDHRLIDLKDLLHHDQNININTQDQNGNTFLIWAARTGARDVIQFLLRQGADISIKNNSGINAIQMAIDHYQYQAADEINRFGRSNSYIAN